MLSSVLALLPFFGLACASAVAKRQDTITTLTAEETEAFRPYILYAAAAYSDPSQILSWSCGSLCRDNPSFQPSIAGGDGSDVPYFYVGFDQILNSVIIGHQGTNIYKLVADLTDGNLALAHLDSKLFPGLSSSILVHQGFANGHAKTAPAILAAVLALLKEHSGSSVTITGHSLGAALALLDSVYLPLHLPEGTRVVTITLGMPRVGNGDFANYIDANCNVTHINNKEDPAPIVPDMSLGYKHPSGEIHIQDSGSWDACPGQDNPSNLCIVGDVPTLFNGTYTDHCGPYLEIFMDKCSLF